MCIAHKLASSVISNLPLKSSGLQILTSRVDSNVPTILPNVFPGFESVLFLWFIGATVGATLCGCPLFHPHYYPLFVVVPLIAGYPEMLDCGGILSGQTHRSAPTLGTVIFSMMQ
jgi:hypothetical protein